MTAAGAWTISLALIYTGVLVVLGRLTTRRRATAGGATGFFVGGRNFSPLTVAFCVTGLFSGSSFIAIMELSYRTGVSAVWYGVAETVQVLLIAVVLLKPLRERLTVTVSGLIGDRFGRTAQVIGGAITAFTFPMWSVATAIAFAAALHAVTGLPLWAAIVATALLLLFFLWAGGMNAVSLTQTINCVVFAAMLAVAIAAVAFHPGFAGIGRLFSTEPRMLDPFSAGTTLIVAWFGTFVVNVILAQATFQMALSCRTARDGQKGLFLAAGFGVPLIVVSVLLGTAAAVVIPHQADALVAIPHYIVHVLPAPLAGVFFLGIWACALGWAGPCQFSGATSLGRDVGHALRPRATQHDLIRYTRWSLLILTGLMIAFAFARSQDSAWWNVLAWTLRNGATLAPVIAAFFWPLASRRAATASMITGFAAGLVWYSAGGWSPNAFYLGLHPVWVGMSANLTALVVVTLITRRWRLSLPRPRRHTAALLTLGLAVTITIAATAPTAVQHLGLGGLLLFTVVTLASAIVIATTTPARPPAPAIDLRDPAHAVNVAEAG